MAISWRYPSSHFWGMCEKESAPAFLRQPAEEADRLYQKVIEGLRQDGLHVEEGVFQAHMMVDILNDGPVTILLDSRKNF